MLKRWQRWAVFIVFCLVYGGIAETLRVWRGASVTNWTIPYLLGVLFAAILLSQRKICPFCKQKESR